MAFDKATLAKAAAKAVGYTVEAVIEKVARDIQKKVDDTPPAKPRRGSSARAKPKPRLAKGV